MRFRVVHKLSSYLLIATAVGALAMSGAVSPLLLLVFAAVAALSWYADPETVWAARVGRVAPALATAMLGLLGWTAWRVVSTLPETDFTPLLMLILALTAYKLLQRRGNRDYLQLYLLSFLMILAAAWLAQTALFALAFAAYVVVSTWTLILFHLRREIEENYLIRHGAESWTEKVTVARVLDSRRVVSRSFFLVTGAVSLAILLGATLVFLLAPRIGIGFFTGGLRRRTSIVGFTDDVRLGQHGVLSMENDTVVLRAKLPRVAALQSEAARDNAIGGLYWRGTVYDTYQQGHWIRSRLAETATHLDKVPGARGSVLAYVSGPGDRPLRGRARALAAAERQEIQLVALTHPVAFAIDAPLAFEIREPGMGALTALDVEPRHSGEVALALRRIGPIGTADPELAGAQYVALSLPSFAGPVLGRGVPLEELPADFSRAYLQVPASLSPRVAALASALTGGKAAPAARINAIVDWLQQTHRYTTQLERNPAIEDPLEDFLFAQQAGHCEYFASATVLLARLAGVPARYVNGFLGGEWNALGQHVTVRDNRAHSWAEAYMGVFGWVRVDATPPAPQITHMGRLKQMADAIEAFWSRWVIEYDTGRQVELARRMLSSLGAGRGHRGSMSWKLPSRRTVTGVVVGAAVVAIAVVWWRRRTRRSRSSVGRRKEAAKATSGVLRHYTRALAIAGRAGLGREDSETAREHARRLVAQGALDERAAAAFETLVRAYERAKFAEGAGWARPDDADVELRACVATFAAGLKPIRAAKAREGSATAAGQRPAA